MAIRTRVWLAVVVLSALILLVDYVTPPLVEFSTAFVLPVLITAWYLGRGPATLLALLLPFLQFLVTVVVREEPGVTTAVASGDFVIRTAVLLLAVFAVTRVQAQQRRIRHLEKLLSICSFCKKIHTADGHWEALESYISSHSDTMFSHGLCEDCLRTHYPQFARPDDDESPGPET